MQISTYIPTYKVINTEIEDLANFDIGLKTLFASGFRINNYIDIGNKEIRIPMNVFHDSDGEHQAYFGHSFPLISLGSESGKSFNKPSNFRKVSLDIDYVYENGYYVDYSVLVLEFVSIADYSSSDYFYVDFIILLEGSWYNNPPNQGAILNQDSSASNFIYSLEYFIQQSVIENPELSNEILSAYSNYIKSLDLDINKTRGIDILINSKNYFHTYDSFEEWNNIVPFYKSGTSHLNSSIEVKVEDNLLENENNKYWLSLYYPTSVLPNGIVGTSRNRYAFSGSYRLILDDYFVEDIAIVMKKIPGDTSGLSLNRYYYFLEEFDKLYKFTASGLDQVLNLEIKENKEEFVTKNTSTKYFSTHSYTVYQYKDYGPNQIQAETREAPIRLMTKKAHKISAAEPWLELPAGYYMISFKSRATTNNTSLSIRLYNDVETRVLDYKTTLGTTSITHKTGFYIPNEDNEVHSFLIEFSLHEGQRKVFIDDIQIERVEADGLDDLSLKNPTPFEKGNKLLIKSDNIVENTIENKHILNDTIGAEKLGGIFAAYTDKFVIDDNVITTKQFKTSVEIDQAPRNLFVYNTTLDYFGELDEIYVSSVETITLDPDFAATINTSNYQVFITPYGNGDAWVENRTPSSFEIHTSAAMNVGYEIKGVTKDSKNFKLPLSNFY